LISTENEVAYAESNVTWPYDITVVTMQHAYYSLIGMFIL